MLAVMCGLLIAPGGGVLVFTPCPLPPSPVAVHCALVVCRDPMIDCLGVVTSVKLFDVGAEVESLVAAVDPSGIVVAIAVNSVAPATKQGAGYVCFPASRGGLVADVFPRVVKHTGRASRLPGPFTLPLSSFHVMCTTLVFIPCAPLPFLLPPYRLLCFATPPQQTRPTPCPCLQRHSVLPRVGHQVWSRHQRPCPRRRAAARHVLDLAARWRPGAGDPG
jgi:hypothetical protein